MLPVKSITKNSDHIKLGIGKIYGVRLMERKYNKSPFQRATYINQARVHMGYHYPRSLTIAVKSAGYFKRFVED